MNDHQTLVPARTVYLFIAVLLLLVGTASAADAPVAAFTSTPAFGTVPLTVNFTDTSTGSPTGWAWFFGDETYTQPWTEQNASSGWSKEDTIQQCGDAGRKHRADGRLRQPNLSERHMAVDR